MISPTLTADMLDATATLLARDGARSARTAAQWATIGAGGATGPGQKGAISDPTGTAVASLVDHPPHEPSLDPCPICIALLSQRWTTAIATMRTIAQRSTVAGPTALGLPAHSLARTLAGAIRNTPRQITQSDLTRLLKACEEIRHVIDQTTPTDRESAAKILADEAKLANACADCRACGTPIDNADNRKLGRYCQWCYKRIGSWQQAFPELVIDEHHTSFETWMRHHIANRIPGFDRPSSIHSPICKTMVSEDVA